MGDQDFAVGAGRLHERAVWLEGQGPSSPTCVNVCALPAGCSDQNNAPVHLAGSYEQCCRFKSTGCMNHFSVRSCDLSEKRLHGPIPLQCEHQPTLEKCSETPHFNNVPKRAKFGAWVVSLSQ